ncbi:diacylglycerol kinase family protein [Candidatus Parcubacteria bacterium]|nr:diacylglycerol kinase family protein [Candidatus Parcubacteria bacterium]
MIRPRLFLESFRHALAGIRTVFEAEQSFRIQVLAALCVIALAGWLRITFYEWIVLLVLIGTVLSLELVNSIFERLADAFKPRLHPMVKEVKDIMAGAVLVMSLVSLTVGIMIFYPYVRTVLSV